MAYQHSLLSVIDASSHTLPIRTFRLPSRPPHAFPPRRLSPRFPRRFLADYQSSRLPAVHADFITFVPPFVPPSRNVHRAAQAMSSASNQFSSADCTAHTYRLRSQYHLTQPRRLTTSMPPARPDIAAARPSRRVAPRGAGRGSMAYPFGADWHGS